MSVFENLKLSENDFQGKLVANLPDKPSEAGLTAQQLKEWFDLAVLEVVMPRLNQVMEELAALTASENLGSAEIAGLLDPEDETQAALTVRAQLTALRKIIDDLLVGQLPSGSIDEAKLVNGAVTTDKLAAGAVTREKMADGAVDHQNLTSALAQQVDNALGVSNEIAQAALFPATLPDGRLEELQADETAGPLLSGSGIALSQPVMGVHVGLSGALSDGTLVAQSVDLGFRPRAVMLFSSEGRVAYRDSYSYYYGGFCMDGHPVVGAANSDTLLEITDTGFTTYTGEKGNDRSYMGHGTHYYLAWR